MKTDTAFVKDFIVMNTYFKAELLGPFPSAIKQEPSDNPFAIADGFAPELRPRAPHKVMLRPLPSDLPEELGTLSELCAASAPGSALTSIEKLATILHYSSAPVRWEPMNNSSTHRGIPSPRFLFTCHTYVLLRRPGTDMLDAFAYWPDDNGLSWVGEAADASAWIGERDVAFCVVGDVSRCAKPYADFSLSLVAPEAGLLSAQLSVLCASVGWKAETKVSFDTEGLRDTLGLTHWTRFPLTIVAVDPAGDDAPVLPEGRERVIWDRFCNAEEVSHLHQVSQFLDNVQQMDSEERVTLSATLAEKAQVVPAAGQRAALDLAEDQIEHPDLADAIRHRSSGVLVGGLAPVGGMLDYATLQGLARDCSLFASLDAFNELRAARIKATATILHQERNLAGQYELDLLAGTITALNSDDIATRYRQTFNMIANLKEMDMVITMSTDQVQAVNDFGKRAFFVVQQATGTLLQYLSLACAKRGRFLRPMRSYTELPIEPILPLDQQLVFQCLIGQSRRANIIYDIG